MEMDRFEEVARNTDTEVQMEVVETDLDREDRLDRVKSRQKEFWTRRMAKDIVEDVLGEVTVFRSTHSVTSVLDGVLEDVVEHSMVNRMYQEIMDSGQSAMDKLQQKVNNRQTVQALVEDMVENVMNVMRLRAKKSLQETKQMEWRRKWKALEQELVKEMDILMELEPDPMDVEEQPTNTSVEVMEVIKELDEEMEYQLEYITYEDWLMDELMEMGITWEETNMNTMEESVIEVGSHRYPLYHGGVSLSPQSHPTIAEKGVEGGNVGGRHLTEDGVSTKGFLNDAPPPTNTRDIQCIVRIVCGRK